MKTGLRNWVKHVILAAGLVANIGFTAVSQAQDSISWPCNIVELAPNTDAEPAPVITALAIHPTLNTMAIVGDDHIVRICDRMSGKVVYKLPAHVDWVRAAQYTPDGIWLVTAGNDHRVVRWSPESAQAIQDITSLEHTIANMAMDPQGRFAAFAGFSNVISIIDLTNDKVVTKLEAPSPDIRSLTISPNGKMLAAGGRNGTVRLWNLDTMQVMQDMEIHSRRVYDIEFSEDSAKIFTAADDRRIVVTEIVSKQSTEIAKLPAKVMALELVGNNMMVSGGSDNKIRIWDLQSNREVGQLLGHKGTVDVLEYDGNRLYSGGFDAQLRIWQVNPAVARQGEKETTPRVSRLPGPISDQE